MVRVCDGLGGSDLAKKSYVTIFGSGGIRAGSQLAETAKSYGTDWLELAKERGFEFAEIASQQALCISVMHRSRQRLGRPESVLPDKTKGFDEHKHRRHEVERHRKLGEEGSQDGGYSHEHRDRPPFAGEQR